MTRFASPETYSKYLATPIQAFMPNSTEWDNFGLRFLQQGALNDVNAEYAALIGAQGDFAAKQIESGFETAAGKIRDQANSNLTNSFINLGVGVGMGGLEGWFNKFKPDAIGTQGNPFGTLPSDSPIFGVPGGGAVGGGRMPLNG